MPLIYRLIALVPTYSIAVWLTFYAYMGDSDLFGVVSLLLVLAGIVVAVQSVWISTDDWTSVLVIDVIVLTVVGIVVGTLSEEIIRDSSLGAATGLLASIATFWLRDMALFRPRLKVFLSYRRNDSAYITGRLRDHLARRYGAKRVFIDVDSLSPGVDFPFKLREFASKCDAILVVIGNAWLDARDETGKRRIEQPGDYVRLEIEMGLESNVPLIPVLVQSTTMPAADQLPASIRDLASRQAVAVRPDPDFSRDVASLEARLEPSRYNQRATNLTAFWPLSRTWTIALTSIIFCAPLFWRCLDEATRDVRRFVDPVLSENGTKLISMNGSTLRLWDLADGKTLIEKRLLRLRRYGRGIAGPPQNGRLLVDYPGSLEVRDADDFDDVYTFRPDTSGSFLKEAALLPDGRSFSVLMENRIVLWAYEDESREDRIVATSDPFESIDAVSWSSTGEKVAATKRYPAPPRLMLFERQGDRLAAVDMEHNDQVRNIAWSPDGRRLAVARDVAPRLLIYDWTVGARSGPRVLPQNEPVNSMAWSPDSLQLASFADRSIAVWNSESGRAEHRWTPDYGLGGPFVAGVWSPDGAVIAIVSGFSIGGAISSDDVLLWEPGKGAPVFRYERKRGIEKVLGWSPDGRRLIVHVESRSRMSYDSRLIVLERDSDAIDLVLSIGVWQGLAEKLRSVF